MAAFEQSCWKRTLRISWAALRTNESVMKQLGLNHKLLCKVTGQKMSYLGHVVRGAGLEQAWMLGMGGGGRGRGRIRTRWLNEITVTADMTLQQAVAACRDQVGWRLLVKAVARGRIRPDSTR